VYLVQKNLFKKKKIELKKTELATKVQSVQEINKNGPIVRYKPMRMSGL
jgi:hypothetical protein